MPFVSQIEDLEFPIVIRPTYREGEKAIGRAKNILKKNSTTRPKIVEAGIQLNQFSIEEIEMAMDRYSEKYDLWKKASKLYLQYPKTKEVDDVLLRKGRF